MKNANAHNGNSNGRKLTEEEVKRIKSEECSVITVTKLPEQVCTPNVEVISVEKAYTLAEDTKRNHQPGDTVKAEQGVEIPIGELPIKNNGERVTRQEPVTIGKGQIEANTAENIRQSAEKKYEVNNSDEIENSSDDEVR